MEMRHVFKLETPPNIHLMNSDEAKCLRRIMSETGLNEPKIRAIKKYRKMLSEAQDLGEKSLTWDEKRNKYIAYLTKQITKELKLPKEHPEVIATLKEKLLERKRMGRLPIYVYNCYGV